MYSTHGADTHDDLAIARRSFIRATAGAVLSRRAPDCARRRADAKSSTTASRSARRGRRGCSTRTSIRCSPPYLADPPRDHSHRRRPPALRGRLPDRRHRRCRGRATRPTYHPAQSDPAARNARGSCATTWRERTKRPLNPAAMVFSDGVFFDPRDRLFKMWYMAGYGAVHLPGHLGRRHRVADGRRSTSCPAPTSSAQALRDSTTVWLDLHETRSARGATRCRSGTTTALVLYTSPDGIHWTEIGTHRPRRRSLDVLLQPVPQRLGLQHARQPVRRSSISGRYRRYWEVAGFRGRAAIGTAAHPVAWVKADSRDFARPGHRRSRRSSTTSTASPTKA